MKRGREIVHGVVTDYLVLVALLGSNLVITPLLLHRLGREGFGLWAVLASLALYLTFLDLGLSTSTAKAVAQYHAEGRHDAASQIVSTNLFLTLLIGVIILASGAVLGLFAPSLFHVSRAFVGTARWSVAMTGAFVALWIPLMGLRGVLVGQQRMDVANLVVAFHIIVAAGLIALLVLAGAGLVGAVAARLLAGIAMGIPLMFALHRFSPSIRLSLAGVRLTDGRESLAFSVSVFIVTSAGIAAFQIGNLVIVGIRGAGAVAAFAVCAALVQLFIGLVWKVSDSFLAPFAELAALGQKEAMQRAFLEASRVSLAVAALFTVGLLFFGRWAIARWVGEGNFVGMAVLGTLACLVVAQGLVHPGIVMLTGLGKARSALLASILELVVNVALSVILMQVLGILGVALGVLIAQTVTTLWVIPRLSLKEVDCPASAFLSRVTAPALIAALPASGAAWLIVRLLPQATLTSLLLGALLTSAVYLACYVGLFTTPEERASYRWLLRASLARTKAPAVPAHEAARP